MTALNLPRRRLRAVSFLGRGSVALALATALALAPARATPEAALPAATVKAAYLQKFPGYVEWPSDAFTSASAPFVIGVAGSEAVFADLIDASRTGRRIQGRAIEVHQVGAGAPPRGLHLLYIGRDAAGDVTALTADLRGTHTLLVTDLPSGLQLGAAINFVENDGRVRFEAAPAAARRAELKLGSPLLSVATRVMEDSGQ
jgi:hypothetical protein